MANCFDRLGSVDTVIFAKYSKMSERKECVFGQLGPIYTESDRQCCDVTSDIALIKLIRISS